MGLTEAQSWLGHLSQCSPCFRDFEHFQLRASRQRRVLWVLTAASVIICASGTLWFKHRGEKGTQVHDTGPVPTAAKIPPVQLTSLSLVLEDSETTRGTENAQLDHLQHLPRQRISLSIYLPHGSEPGQYELELFADLSGSFPVARYQEHASFEKDVCLLHLDTDFSAFKPGTYVLRFRRAGTPWRYSRVAIL